MSFYIKSFTINPKATSPEDALPDGTKINFKTVIECLKHGADDKFSFVYTINEGTREVATSERTCGSNKNPHEITDNSNAVTSNWGNGLKSLVRIVVTVTKQNTGDKQNTYESTWVEK